MDERVSGKTKLIGLIGNPVEHTLSPQLHNTLSAMLGIDAVYVPFKVEKDSLESAVKGLKACNFLGFNATIPFKEELIKYVDEYTEEVRLIGAANTVKNKDGRLYAYNTDAEGFARSFEEQAGTGFENKRVVLLGGGGAARSLAVKIASKGAAKLHIVNRTTGKAIEIADTVNTRINGIASAMDFYEMEKNGVIEQCDVVVNATSLGMHPNVDVSPLSDAVRFDERQIIYDLIYRPAGTKLMKQAEKSGCKTINGLGMLFYQGILAYEIWMDMQVPREIAGELYGEFSKYLYV